MNTSYFQQLNQTLKSYKRAIPSLLIDLDLLDQNIEHLQKVVAVEKAFRIVVKSLPSVPLLDYIMGKTATRKLMVFHQPFLSELARQYGNTIDILLGKPMPVQTAGFFYQSLAADSAFIPSQQLQWLIDTKARLQQYIALSRKIGERIRVNLEIDVGLHRGGFHRIADLKDTLQLIAANEAQIEFSGFMGYDPHITHVPKFLRSPEKSFQLANNFYRQCIQLVKEEFPSLWNDRLTFNGAGSPTLSIHQTPHSVLNDIAAGSALVKPSSFDNPSLADFTPACFIATPVLKKLAGTTLPALEKFKPLLGILKPAYKKSYFIYGGYWKADYHYPPQTAVNAIFGPSTNQSMINTASTVELEVDDFVFLRPIQSEFVFLQFGKLLALRNGRIHDEWPVLRNN